MKKIEALEKCMVKAIKECPIGQQVEYTRDFFGLVRHYNSNVAIRLGATEYKNCSIDLQTKEIRFSFNFTSSEISKIVKDALIFMNKEAKELTYKHYVKLGWIIEK